MQHLLCPQPASPASCTLIQPSIKAGFFSLSKMTTGTATYDALPAQLLMCTTFSTCACTKITQGAHSKVLFKKKMHYPAQEAPITDPTKQMVKNKRSQSITGTQHSTAPSSYLRTYLPAAKWILQGPDSPLFQPQDPLNQDPIFTHHSRFCRPSGTWSPYNSGSTTLDIYRTLLENALLSTY